MSEKTIKKYAKNTAPTMALAPGRNGANESLIVETFLRQYFDSKKPK
jgi:hypothetical protein